MPTPRHYCTVDGCQAPVKGHGLCNAHYLRLRRYGRLELLSRPSLEERFWAKVRIGSTEDCWPWQGFIWKHGYGNFGTREQERLAHRWAWKLTNGTIPADTLVCHACDNRRCCNPSHLFLGTYTDNYTDAVTKGRSSRGEAHPISKLTERQVRTIRRKAATGVTFYALGKQFNVADIHIARIVRRLAWRHVP